LILRAALEERQVEKACFVYGAVPTESQLI
jgi:hypothetical protein